MTYRTFDDARIEFLDDLAARIDEHAREMSAYWTESEDAAQPLFYPDWEVDLSHLDAEARAMVDVLREREPRDWQAVLKSRCDVQCVGVDKQANEVSSFLLGEIHVQLDDDMVAELDALTSEERAYVSRSVRECYLPDSGGCIYLNHDYDRWVLILDTEQLADYLSDA